MATKRGSAKVSAEKNKFQEMREDLDKKFSELTSLVNQRKIDLDRKIDNLELEYNNKNKQIEKDRETLIKLKEHNAQKLSQNSLIHLQENINKEIAEKIQELTTEHDGQLTSQLTLDFDFDALKGEIGRIEIVAAFESAIEISLSGENSFGIVASFPKPQFKKINPSFRVANRRYFGSLLKDKAIPIPRLSSPIIPVSKRAKYDPLTGKSQARLK